MHVSVSICVWATWRVYRNKTYFIIQRSYKAQTRHRDKILSNLGSRNNCASNYKAIIPLKTPLRCFITFYHADASYDRSNTDVRC